MSSIVETIQKHNFFPSNQKLQLPLSQSPSSSSTTNNINPNSSQSEPVTKTLRRRLSSLNIHNPISSNSSRYYSSWTFPRSKSVSSMGEYAGTSVRKWWDRSWNWILSRKTDFPKDLELNEHETAFLGSNNSKGTWRHVLYKLGSDFRKLVGSDNNVSLPQTYRYDSASYAKNFDNGSRSFQH